MLFVGQIGERKGISYLLQAYRRFCKVDTELHLVGDVVPGAEVYRRFRLRGLGRQIELPESLRDLVVRRLRYLPETTLELLRITAVLGDTVLIQADEMAANINTGVRVLTRSPPY